MSSRFGNCDYLGRDGISRKVWLGIDSVCDVVRIATIGKSQKLGFGEETSFL